MSDSEVYCPNYAPFFGFAGVFCAVKYFDMLYITLTN